MAVWLEGPLEALGSQVELGSETAHQAVVCKTRTFVQPSKEVPVMMAETASGKCTLMEACPLECHGRWNILPNGGSSWMTAKHLIL